jgi:hypothetical protein
LLASASRCLGRACSSPTLAPYSCWPGLSSCKQGTDMLCRMIAVSFPACVYPDARSLSGCVASRAWSATVPALPLRVVKVPSCSRYIPPMPTPSCITLTQGRTHNVDTLVRSCTKLAPVKVPTPRPDARLARACPCLPACPASSRKRGNNMLCCTIGVFFPAIVYPSEAFQGVFLALPLLPSVTTVPLLPFAILILFLLAWLILVQAGH